MGGNNKARRTKDDRFAKTKDETTRRFFRPSSLVPRPSFLAFTFIILVAVSYAIAAQSTRPLSGLNLNDFQQETEEKMQWETNPFVQPANDLVVQDMKLTGLVVGKDDAAALINDQVVMRGDKMGRNQIVDINNSSVILKSEAGLYNLSMGGALTTTPPVRENEYNVEFRGAALKGALRLLAKMDDKNIVVPDKMDVTVTASFESTPLLDALDSILQTNSYGYVEQNGILMVMDKKDLEAGGEDLEAASFSLLYAKADQTLPQVQSFISNRGSAIADDRTNSIHIRDIRSAVSNIRSFINSIDKKGKQVLIEVKILDANTSFVRSLGIQWGVTKSGGRIQMSGLQAVGTDNAGRSLMLNTPGVGYNNGPPLAGIGMILGSFKGVLTDIQLSAAEQKGDVKIISRPTIATMDNQAAKIRSGTKFYVNTNGNISIGGGGGSTTNTVGSTLQEIDTGIELDVTPQISDNDYIQLNISATQSEADFAKAINGIPAVNDNEAQTTVALRDGETTIIGGLFNLRDAKTVKGVPGLMKVPILGNLFRSKTKESEKSELLIFITPKIIDSAVTMLPSFEEPTSEYNPANIEEKNKPKPKNRSQRRFNN